MHEKDYYKVLGLNEGASDQEIKSAYRKLALKFHPDRAAEPERKQAEEKFKGISAAYYVLSDPKRKQEYDTVRSGGYAFSGSGSDAGDFASQAGFNFEDLMRHFNAAGGARTRKRSDSNKYFFFEDLADVFGGLGGTSRDEDADTYQVYRFGGENPRAKHDTNSYVSLNIPKALAERGGEAKFKLSNGKKISLAIKPGTQNGQKVRLRELGHACPTCDHNGDLIVTFQIK
ncbi:MAG: DnaJ domain-containing protein [Candidatus Omnitrophica bacterium]|nr:DnaJ domain-containing protein [Candidatus Omnitrophota bacterium]MBU1925176.1 DnaJ domain-containing protein [Candidatus Omnitrophota bacterium]